MTFTNMFGTFETYICLKCGKTFDSNFKPKLHNVLGCKGRVKLANRSRRDD